VKKLSQNSTNLPYPPLHQHVGEAQRDDSQLMYMSLFNNSHDLSVTTDHENATLLRNVVFT